MSSWGGATLQIIELLTKHGEMTTIEISRRTGIRGDVVRRVCNRISEPTVYIPKRIYVCAWAYEVFGSRNYPRPIYDVGDYPNVPKPKRPPRKEHSRNYRQRNVNVQWGKVASVFDIGAVRI